MSLWSTVAADLEAMADLRRRPLCGLGIVDNLLVPGVLATILYRLASACHRRGLRPLSRLLYVANVVLFGCDIAPEATIGPGMVIGHPVGVVVSGPTVIGRNIRLFGQGGFGGAGRADASRDGFPVVGDNVLVYQGARAVGPIRIGDGAVLGLNATVLHDVPAGATAMAMPARHRTFARQAAGTGPGEASEA